MRHFSVASPWNISLGGPIGKNWQTLEYLQTAFGTHRACECEPTLSIDQDHRTPCPWKQQLAAPVGVQPARRLTSVPITTSKNWLRILACMMLSDMTTSSLCRQSGEVGGKRMARRWQRASRPCWRGGLSARWTVRG